MSDHLVTVIALLLAGYLLLAVELFVIPGFGKAGIAGMLLLIVSSVLAFRWLGTGAGVLTVVLVIGSTTAIIAYIPRSRIGREVILRGNLEQAHAVDTTLSLGSEGVAASDLRPSGIAHFGPTRESVVTGGEYISSGTRVKVVLIDGARVVVEAIA